MDMPIRQPGEKNRLFALRALRENIASLALKPGSRVRAAELAERMGLPPASVREALGELENFGVVEFAESDETGDEAFISLIDYGRIEESRFMRLALEIQVVQDACDLATPEFIEEMDDLVQIQALYLQNRNMKMLLEMDKRFHRLLFDVCGRSLSHALIQNMAVHFDRVHAMMLETGSKDIRLVEDHRHILYAVRARDKERARETMLRHLSRYRMDLPIIGEQFREYINNG